MSAYIHVYPLATKPTYNIYMYIHNLVIYPSIFSWEYERPFTFSYRNQASTERDGPRPRGPGEIDFKNNRKNFKNQYFHTWVPKT